MSFFGCAYAHPKEQIHEVERLDNGAPWDLTRSQLLGVTRLLRGKPVVVEHHGTVVGYIEDATQDATDGSMYVKFQLHDDVKGQTARELIACGTARELSLRHDYIHAMDAIVPVEISLVQKGAREGTQLLSPWELYKRSPSAARQLRAVLPVMASATEPPASDSMGAPPDEPPPTKKMRVEEDNSKFLARIGEGMSEEDRIALFDRFTNQTKMQVDLTQQLEEFKTEKMQLEHELNEIKTKTRPAEALQETQARDIIKILNQMYSTASEEAEHAKLHPDILEMSVTEMKDAPNMVSLLNRIVPVCASALTRQKKENSDLAQRQRALETVEAELAALTGRGSAGTDRHVPLFTTVNASSRANASKGKDAKNGAFASIREQMKNVPDTMSLKVSDVFYSKK